jgi:hypothetical protein
VKLHPYAAQYHREEVEIRTQGIIHLEHHVETQDVELEERAEMITDLGQ